jgi:hypothetical protein
MSNHTFQLLLVLRLVTGRSWAANDPFVGRWKLNASKSELTDEMEVESLGANKYALDLGGGATETVVADIRCIRRAGALSCWGTILRPAAFIGRRAGSRRSCW